MSMLRRKMICRLTMPSHLEKGLKTALRFGNQPNCITLGKISENEKMEIIQKGFQLQAEGKISLKYYESIRKDMSFQNFIKI